MALRYGARAMRTICLLSLSLSLFPVARASARADEEEVPERLTLDDAVRIARRSHPTVLSAQRGEDVAVAREREGMAPLLPSLTASFGYLPQTANSNLTPSLARSLASGSSSSNGSNVSLVPGHNYRPTLIV